MRRRLRELAVLVAVGGLMMAGCSSSDKKASVTDAQGKNVAESQSQEKVANESYICFKVTRIAITGYS